MASAPRRSQTHSVVSDLSAVGVYALLKLVLPPEAPAPARAPDFAKPSSRQEPLAAQQRRAREPGRGRLAATPAQIPWRGWKDIFWRTYEQMMEDRLLAIAAGVVFYGLLALFPAITALVSLYGLFASPATIAEHLNFLAGIMPDAVVGIVDEQIARVVAKGDINLSFGFAFGLGLALLCAIAAIVAMPLLFDGFGLKSLASSLIGLARWPVLVVGTLFALAPLYRYGPSRREPTCAWVTVGSLIATVSWVAGSAAFSYYLAKYAHYDVTYGSLGAGIGLMMWMWMTAIVILLGAEINSEVEHQTAVDTTRGPAKPLGSRGATMADTVGAAQG
jgi:membrane protein